MSSSSSEYISKIIKDFDVDSDLLKKLTNLYIKSMKGGLESSVSTHDYMPMIPTFITNLPTGLEQDSVLACDLGGTSFRCLYLSLKGNSKYEDVFKKWDIPSDYLNEEGANLPENALFDYLAKKILPFVKNLHQKENFKQYKLGFTFSYPVEQEKLDKGTLIRWTKGFQIESVVGKDIIFLLQQSLDKYLKRDYAEDNFEIKVVALSNDTTGTLLSGSYTSKYGVQDVVDPIMSIICGTGFNVAYIEDMKNIKKFQPEIEAKLKSQGATEMVINTETGSFDNNLEVLPHTKYDDIIDKESTNPGYHLFEKRISGMFLGEILRLVLVDLVEHNILTKPATEKLYTKFALKTEVLSHIEIDDSKELKETQLYLNQALDLKTTPAQRLQIQSITRAISRRSAYFVSVPISAIIISTGRLDENSAKYKYHQELEISCDGSVIQYYPGYKSMVRHGLAIGELGPEGERRIHISIAWDGSGLGAGLAAASATI
ncbi:hypothetical protein QEN19_002975 [Hanseniaspora menglaensis]